MTAQGWVKTARGQLLNLDKLISTATKPVNEKDMKSQITKKAVPGRNPINIRGFQPQAGEAATTVKVETEETKPAKKVEKKTMAEMTGIVVNQPKYLKRKEKSQDLTATTDAALKEVLNELNTAAHETDADPETV